LIRLNTKLKMIEELENKENKNLANKIREKK